MHPFTVSTATQLHCATFSFCVSCVHSHDSMCECLELDGSVLGERVCIYFASIFTIYNYISSPFAYDALKPFIYCH